MEPTSLTTGARKGRSLRARSRIPSVLYVEENEVDVLSMRLAFRHAGVTRRLEIVSTVEEALDYMSRSGVPTLLLLALRLPTYTGLELLRWLRQYPKFE